MISVSVTSLVLLFFEIVGSSLGLPGGMVAMIAIGSLSQNIFALIIVIIISFVAAIIGDLIAYYIGRRVSQPLLTRLRNFNFFSKNEEKAKRLLYKYGFFIVFITRFAVTNLCAIISYVSGLEKYNKKKFVIAVLFGEFLYVVIYSVIGYFIGSVLNTLLSTINYVVAAVVVLFIIYQLGKYFVSRRVKY